MEAMDQIYAKWQNQTFRPPKTVKSFGSYKPIPAGELTSQIKLKYVSVYVGDFCVSVLIK